FRQAVRRPQNGQKPPGRRSAQVHISKFTPICLTEQPQIRLINSIFAQKSMFDYQSLSNIHH
ncbi:hypothetical protein, partial [Parabacteroides sp.]